MIIIFLFEDAYKINRTCKTKIKVISNHLWNWFLGNCSGVFALEAITRKNRIAENQDFERFNNVIETGEVDVHNFVEQVSVSGRPPKGFLIKLSKTSKSWFSTNPYFSILFLIQVCTRLRKLGLTIGQILTLSLRASMSQERFHLSGFPKG